jgi:hypothetical protein
VVKLGYDIAICAEALELVDVKAGAVVMTLA